jgi:hypothetical protein
MLSRKISKHNTFKMIVGVMDDNGLFPGRMELGGAGGGTSPLFMGMENSSISLFRSIPVLGDSIFEPKYAFTVLVMETAFRSISTTEI